MYDETKTLLKSQPHFGDSGADGEQSKRLVLIEREISLCN